MRGIALIKNLLMKPDLDPRLSIEFSLILWLVTLPDLGRSIKRTEDASEVGS